MRENADQNNSEYGHSLHSASNENCYNYKKNRLKKNASDFFEFIRNNNKKKNRMIKYQRK